jgi:Spy/CpxP family protein refolding chaperone
MKQMIAVALLSAAVVTSASAEEITPHESTIKSTTGSPLSARSHLQKTPIKEDCDAEHSMEKYHEENIMDQEGFEMMAKPDIHMLGSLSLGKEQESRIKKLADELRHSNWTTQGLINDETAKLRDLYEADKRDPIAIGKEYLKIYDLKRQMIESDLNTQIRVEEILTPEQIAKMKSFHEEMHHMHKHPMND